jgi:hypothetical protein
MVVILLGCVAALAAFVVKRANHDLANTVLPGLKHEDSVVVPTERTSRAAVACRWLDILAPEESTVVKNSGLMVEKTRHVACGLHRFEYMSYTTRKGQFLLRQPSPNLLTRLGASHVESATATTIGR